ncbi:uncharacterized protein LOC135102445 isoform X3 [Scylla paramamosain]|uniref:uncharacterized protein LOC135102445 isoform X3 n=1 Tax=Scylla paramamosain TaxID=85552 RepID=UPI0030832110
MYGLMDWLAGNLLGKQDRLHNFKLHIDRLLLRLLQADVGGTRAVAFEVGPPDASDSLIRRHPPRKFQRLEDQQQANTITQEQLEEKQATAERRRQEILTQRVQSAKHRSAMRMRPDNDDGDEVEKFMMTEELDWMSLVNTSLLPPIKHSTAPQSHHQNLSYVSST